MSLIFITVGLIITYAYFEYDNYKKHNELIKSIYDSEINSNITEYKHRSFQIQNFINCNIILNDNLEITIKQWFYNKKEIYEISYDDLYNFFKILFYNCENLSYKHTELIYNCIDKIENKLNLKFQKGIKYNDYIKVGTNDFKIWYVPFVGNLIKSNLKHIFGLWMKFNNFNLINLDNNYKVWYRNNNSKNNLCAFHCSILGASSLMLFINKIKNLDYNIYIPEIPGICYDSFVNKIRKIEYYNDLLYEYFVSNNITNIDMIGHSFGGMCLTKFFYKYNYIINKTIFIEAPVFSINVFKLHNESIELNRVRHFWIIPLMHRDPYVMFYFYKNVDILNTNIYLEYLDKINKKINIILVDLDDKIPSIDYLNYVNKYNSDKVNLKIFNNNSHGAFLYKDSMQKYVISLLNESN